ncbi:uncharacterized protein LOC115701133 isoform X1 [Cannabis sativa]|uniref:uncharacterized protein LOC115701133 isoform X1 n=1 Tax=Cannabis sativa TaxID=3483 RepID=UPI0029CA185C|nr:uncharacterized protein LOC115701133 isoform X1 [Cannabis sativa]XP_060968374.1 uncharacterized protein LOC115701133 isoform X1 [Cannabis sativa]
MDQLKTIMTLLLDPGRPVADSQPQPQSQPEEEARTPEDDFILPNDYQPDDDDIFCTPEKTNIISIGDTQDSEVQVLETAPEVMENRRKSRRPRWFAEYAEMKKKARATSTLVNADPLRVVDRKLLRTFHNWVLGQIGNKYPREYFTGLYDSSWFLELHIPRFWLGNVHLDAAFHLMRRRQHFYPEVYPNRCVIMPCIFPAGVIARWEAAGDDQPDDDDMFCTPEKTNIISIGDTQDSELQVLETAPEVMENRRKSRRPRWFAEYAEMKKKARATSTLVNADPLRVVDRKLLKTFHNWVLGQIGNKYPREYFTGLYDSSWFLELHIPRFWLGNVHLDAAFHLMRRRQHFNPEVHPNRCVIMLCIFPSGVIARWEAAGDDQANYQ